MKTPGALEVARIPSVHVPVCVVMSVVPVCVVTSVPVCAVNGVRATPCVKETPCVEETPSASETPCVSGVVASVPECVLPARRV